MPADGHAMIGSINDICVVQFAHCLELGEHTSDLSVDVFATGKLPADLVTNCLFIAPLPNARYFHLIAQIRMAVMKWMFR